MKTYNTRPPGFLKLAALAIIGFAATTAFVQGTAFADTAANTVIRNTAQVTWEDSDGGTGNASASVDITVNLVAAAADISTPADDSVFSTNTVEYTYTLTSNANGPDDYFFNPAPAQTATTGNITGVNLEINDGPGGTGSSYNTTDAFSLSATTVATDVTIPANGSATVEVPNDGNAGDGFLNGFVGGETILVNNWVLTLDSVDTDVATGVSTVTISDSTGNARALTTGMLIAQQRTFYLRVTPTATIEGSTSTVTTTVTDGTNAVTDDTVTTVNIAPSITVTKYVRNVGPCHGTLSDCNPAAGSVTINGELYWAAGVTGDAGDTLEYVIVVENAANAGTALNVIISDPIPEFTTYVNNSLLLDNDTAANAGTVPGWAITPTDTEADTDEGEVDLTVGSEEVWIYAGSGGSDTGAAAFGDGSGGSVNGGSYTFGAFQVTIDN